MLYLKTRPVCAKVASNYKPEEEEEEERFDCDAEVDGATSSLLMGHDTNMLSCPMRNNNNEIKAKQKKT